MTPNPPGRSCSLRIGHGFQMSKRRNQRNPKIRELTLTDEKQKTIGIAASSSQTTSPGSLRPMSFDPRVQIGMPISSKSSEASILGGVEANRFCPAATISTPTALPHVPGAERIRPTPKPVARNSTSRSLNRGACGPESGVGTSEIAIPLLK